MHRGHTPLLKQFYGTFKVKPTPYEPISLVLEDTNSRLQMAVLIRFDAPFAGVNLRVMSPHIGDYTGLEARIVAEGLYVTPPKSVGHFMQLPHWMAANWLDMANKMPERIPAEIYPDGVTDLLRQVGGEHAYRNRFVRTGIIEAPEPVGFARGMMSRLQHFWS